MINTEVKMSRVTIFLFLTLVSAAYIFAQSRQTTGEGSKPYTPTRMEWLLLEDRSFNSRTPISCSTGTCLIFTRTDESGDGAAKDTIVIHVRFSKNVPAAELDSYVEARRNGLENNAKQKGWESWLKIKEKRLVDPLMK